MPGGFAVDWDQAWVEREGSNKFLKGVNFECFLSFLPVLAPRPLTPAGHPKTDGASRKELCLGAFPREICAVRCVSQPPWLLAKSAPNFVRSLKASASKERFLTPGTIDGHSGFRSRRKVQGLALHFHSLDSYVFLPGVEGKAIRRDRGLETQGWRPSRRQVAGSGWCPCRWDLK